MVGRVVDYCVEVGWSDEVKIVVVDCWSCARTVAGHSLKAEVAMGANDSTEVVTVGSCSDCFLVDWNKDGGWS